MRRHWVPGCSGTPNTGDVLTSYSLTSDGTLTMTSEQDGAQSTRGQEHDCKFILAVLLSSARHSNENPIGHHAQALASNANGSASAEGKEEFFHLNSGLARIGCVILCTQCRMVAELL